MTENRPLTAGQKKWLSTGLTVISLSAGLALNANILKAQAADQPAMAASSSSVTAVTASEPTTTDTADKTQESTATETETDDTKTTEKQSAGDEDVEKNQSTATDEQPDDKVQADTESQTDAREKTPAEPVAPQNQGSSSSELNDDEKTTGSSEKVSEQPDQSEVVKTVQKQQVTTADNDKKQTVPPVETTDEKTDQRKFVVADSRLFSSRLFLARMNVPMAASLLAYAVDTPVETDADKFAYTYTPATADSAAFYTITGYTGNDTDIILPDQYNNVNVAAIADNAFAFSKTGRHLNSVQLGKNIATIGSAAFKGTDLKSIDFNGTTSLWSIGGEAFTDDQLTGKLELPESITVIGSKAFAGNSDGTGNQLTGLTVGPKVTTILDSAFANNQLTGDLSLPNTLTKIDASAFANNDLTSVELGTPAVSSDEVGPKLTTIGANAFANNQLSGGLIIPDTVTTVGASAFAGNGDGKGNQLTSVTFLGGQLQEIWTNAFANNNLNTISFTGSDENSLNIEESAFAFNKNLNQLALNEGVGYIAQNAFLEDGYSGTLELPNSLETIGTSAFEGNHITGLTMNIDESKLNSIGDNAFLNNAIDGNLELANSLDSIGVSAFRGNKITDVKFGSGSRIIGDYSFADNPFNVTDNENTLIIPDSVTTIGDYAFSRSSDNSPKEQIPKVKLGKSVKTIGVSAFENVGLTDKIVIPGTVTDIGASAFKDNSLAGLELGGNVNTIGESAFESTDLTDTLSIPNSVTVIGENAFANNHLVHLELGSGVGQAVAGNMINDLAFSGNDLQTIVTAGELTDSLGDNAFAQQQHLGPFTVEVNGNKLIGVRAAIESQLNSKNSKQAQYTKLFDPMSFTFGDQPLTYNFDTDTLTLPQGYTKSSIELKLTSGHTGKSTEHSGNYGVEKLTLKWTPQSSGSGTNTTPDTPTAPETPGTPGTSTPTTSTTPKNKSPKNKSPKSKSSKPKHPTTKSNKTTSKQPAGKKTRQTATQYRAQPQGHRATAAVRRPQSLSWHQLTTTHANGTSTPTTGWHYSQAQGIWVRSAGTLTPATSATLPQTREQPATGWQLVGLALLSGLSWFGLRRKRN